MGRLLKILSVAVILFFLYLWAAIFLKSCNNDKEPTIFEEIGTETPSEADIFDVDTIAVSSDDEYIDDAEDAIDYNELDAAIEETYEEPVASKPKAQTSKPVQTKSAPAATHSNNSGGKYFVICGSFLVEENANQMRRKLNKLGYNGAEVVVFDLSQYHSVSAGRYDDYSVAQQQLSSLKRQGIDAYVHRKK
jgi:cell division septation protein DedD